MWLIHVLPQDNTCVGACTAQHSQLQGVGVDQAGHKLRCMQGVCLRHADICIIRFDPTHYREGTRGHFPPV